MFAFSHEMFAHANQYRDVYRAMVGTDSGATVQRVLHKLLVDLVREDVRGAMPRGERLYRIPAEALVQFIAGALSLLICGLMDPCGCPSPTSTRCFDSWRSQP